MQLEAVAPIQNKVGQFIASPMIRNIVGQEVSTIDFRTFMDQKKIVIINISKGIIGPENMRLLGGMLITKIQLAAMSRANLDEDALKRIPNTYLYVDEFQNFANESFAEILSESRKYKLCLTVANQYIDQMTEEVRNAVIGNVGTFISFRVGSTDAELMEKEFAPNFVAEDMVNLGFTQMYLKLMIDGIGSRPFSANSLPPIPKPEKSYIAEIVGFSRKYFSNDKEKVEASIKEWTSKDFGTGTAPQRNDTAPNSFRTDAPPRRPDTRVYDDRKPAPKRDDGRRDDRRTQPRRDSGTDRGPDRRKTTEPRDYSGGDKRVDKPAAKRESPRKKALQNLKLVHALSANQKKPAKQELEEVPDDLLKSLLDTSGL
jgi:hypothetical protein